MTRYLPVHWPSKYDPNVHSSEIRFQNVRTYLKERGILHLGYTDGIAERVDYRDSTRTRPYYLAQYVLAPLTLDDDTIGHEYILGNFASNIAYKNITARRDLRVANDFGNGVVLLEKIK